MDEHQMYEKISDDLMMLGNGIVLRFSTQLASKGKDGTRYNYHKEFQYKSGKYTGMPKLRTVRRNFSSFLSFEEIGQESEQKLFIKISPQNFYNVLNKVSKFKQFLESGTVYKFEENRTYVISQRSMGIVVNDSSSFSLSPCIFADYNNKEQIGVRIEFEGGKFVEIHIFRFMEFARILEQVNFYEYGMLQVNYLGRPDYGTNMYEFGNNPMHGEPPLDDFIEDNKKTNGRREPGIKKQKSYFDKIDSL